MRKTRLTFIVAMLAVTVSTNAQLNLGVKGGVNMSNMYDDELTDKYVKIGFNVGLLLDYEITYNSAIQSGLFFTTKGYQFKKEMIGSLLQNEATCNPMYLQIPVHFAYKITVTPGMRVMLHAGPYAAYGVGGKSKLKHQLTVFDEVVSSSVNLFSGNRFKAFDAGLGLGVGAEFGSFLVDLGWDLGLVDVLKSDNVKSKNQNAYLSVGFKF